MSLRDEFIKKSVSRTLENAEIERRNGVHATEQNMTSDLMLSVPELEVQGRNGLLKDYLSTVTQIDNSRSPAELEQGFAAAAGDALKLFAEKDANKALSAFDRIFPTEDEFTQRHSQFLLGVRSELVKKNNDVERSNITGISASVAKSIDGATSSAALSHIMGQAKLHEAKLGLDFSVLLLKAADKSKSFALSDEVDSAMRGQKVVLTKEHDKFIDERVSLALRNGVSPSRVIPFVAFNTKITDTMVEQMNIMSINDPNEAARTLAGLEQTNPSAVNQLLQNNKITYRTKTYLQMNKNFGFKIEDVAASLQGVPDSVFDLANDAFEKPEQYGLKSATQTIISGLDTISIGDQPTWITSKFNNFYRDAFMYQFAKISKESPGTGVKEIASRASSKALGDIKSSYTLVKLNGDNIPVQSNQSLPSSEFEALNKFYTNAISVTEAAVGLKRGSLKPDLYGIKKDEKGQIIIPIIYPSAFTGDRSLFELVLPSAPADREELYGRFRDSGLALTTKPKAPATILGSFAQVGLGQRISATETTELIKQRKELIERRKDLIDKHMRVTNAERK